MKDLAKNIYKKYKEGGKVEKYQSDLLKEVEGMGPEGKRYLKDKLAGKEYKGELRDEYKHDLDKELEGMSEKGRLELKKLLGVDEDPWKDVKEELNDKKKDKKSIGELMAHSEEGYKKGGEVKVIDYADPKGMAARRGIDKRGEYRTRRGGGRKNKAFDRLSDEAMKLPFLIGSDPDKDSFEKHDPDRKHQDYYGVGVEGGWKTLRESEGDRRKPKARQITKDVLKIKDPVFRVKQRRNPKTSKIQKYVQSEEDVPWYEGGAFPRRRSISISGGRRRGDSDIPKASEFRNKEIAERLSKISPYEKLEGEGMTHTRKSPEFKSELHSSPRDFKDMPKESRKGLRKMSGYGDAGDLELRHFGEAFSKADEEGKAKLAKANPGLAKELGFKEGGEANWIQGAVKKPGALRAIAEKEKLIKGDEKLSGKDLNKLASQAKKKKNKLLAKRVALAKTFAKMRK